MGNARWALLLLLVPPVSFLAAALLYVAMWLMSLLYGLDTVIAIVWTSPLRLIRAGTSREYASGFVLLVCSLFGLWPVGLLLSSRLEQPRRRPQRRGPSRLKQPRRRPERRRPHLRVLLVNGQVARDDEDD
jgi:hypothetical protein